ncbi:MAG: helix-turn-helix transcriptional regulator [Thermoguttaceae bacterium]|jgi:predicted transcriptional regulator|nr:helix-turn-helix transcriptional regulator [Thermoguttaceae bacterium]
MAKQRIHRKIERTAAERRRLEEIRERFQRERPGLNSLLATGDADEAVAHGEYLDLRIMLAALKKHREAMGLSLSDVSDRSGMDRSAVSRLENGVYVNPTVDTLYRYAEAIGTQIAFSVRFV